MVKYIQRPPVTQADDEEEEHDEPKPFYYYAQPASRQVHHYYISSVIEEPHQYVDLIHRLITSHAEEIVYIHLNTIGGNLATGVQIINAMRQSRAHIVASVEGEAYSLGTLIFLAADEWVVHDNCMFMFHDFSSLTVGKGHSEQKASLDASLKWYRDLATSLYIPFLSEAELDCVLRGEDLYLHSDDVRKRLDKLVKQMEKDHKKAQQDAENKVKRTIIAAEKRAQKKAAKSKPVVIPTETQ